MATVRLRLGYLVVVLGTLVILVLIESQFDGGFIRHSVGDALVVVAVYAFVMAFSTWSQFTSGIVSLAIAYAVEVSQALNLVERLGLTPNRLTDVILGSTFAWADIVAYNVGIGLTLIVEALISARGFRAHPDPTTVQS